MDRKYAIEFDPDVRYRVEFQTERGDVTDFVVQLEAKVNDHWVPVVRYDSAHGFPHRDRYLPDGTVSKHEPMPISGMAAALTHAVDVIKRDWVELSREFLRTKP